MGLAFLYDDRFLAHRTPAHHPERPERLSRLVRHLRARDLWESMIHLEPSAAPMDAVREIHTQGHLDRLRRCCEAGGGVLDGGDTCASEQSLEVALLAAGAVLRAVDAVAGGEADSAFCAVRPPGHHAERDEPMGFCLLNNVAIAARHAQGRHGIDRVAILDWDVHHGNGTQHVFEEDPSVLYVSLHQYPLYPGTGARSEQGLGRGKGATLNIPLPAGAGETEYRAAFHGQVLPALEDFRPGLLLISAGFDAHRDDPLAGMNLTEESYAEFTRLVKGCAPVISVLEGGYDLGALARSVESHLLALRGS